MTGIPGFYSTYGKRILGATILNSRRFRQRAVVGYRKKIRWFACNADAFESAAPFMLLPSIRRKSAT
jgi:hypothetical protein